MIETAGLMAMILAFLTAKFAWMVASAENKDAGYWVASFAISLVFWAGYVAMVMAR